MTGRKNERNDLTSRIGLAGGNAELMRRTATDDDPRHDADSGTRPTERQGGNGGPGGVLGGGRGGGGGDGESPRITYGSIQTQHFTQNNISGGIQILGSAASEERTKIIEWLSPVNFFLRHADISNARQSETGGWLLADSLLKQWESDFGRTLWCRGIRAFFTVGPPSGKLLNRKCTAGVGKTVLASMVLDHLSVKSEHENIGVAFVYLNHKEAKDYTRTLATPVSLVSPVFRLHAWSTSPLKFEREP
ncbi:hypothetical protein DFH09DRAFT_1086977 [Mycena vulgaris]|nr:hypothetical protein DFH09DRAFT_1086977 [Mycena vulgaris]